MSKTKKIAIQGVMLAIMLVFQTMKGISPYITGPVVNLVLIAVTYYFSLPSGILFSIIAPITSFFITPSPILKAMPMIVVFIALGNIVLCFFVNLLKNKNLALDLFIASTIKAIFMGISISSIIIPIFSKGTQLPEAALATAKFTFSITQLITAYIASFISYFALKNIKLENTK